MAKYDLCSHAPIGEERTTEPELSTTDPTPEPDPEPDPTPDPEPAADGK